MDVEVEEEAVQLLEKYTNHRPGETGLILDRIVREWYARAAKSWRNTPGLIPKLPKVPEGKTMKVRINKTHAKIYKKTIEKLNQIHGLEIKEACLTSYLTRMFCRIFEIKKKAEKYKIKFGKFHKV